jgi:DNA-binding transcriptional MerR regulator
MDYSIGELGRRTSTKVTTIRFYEAEGLLPKPARSAGNHRTYDASHLQRLAFIRHARELGFPLDAVRELLQLAAYPARPCARADDIARKQLAEVESRMKRLRALQRELKRMLDHCSKGTHSQCRIIETLSNHDLCASEH